MGQQQQEVMLDLETLGVGNKACILSIGACLFDPHGQGIVEGSEFEVFVDPRTCLQLGMELSMSTVLWWMGAEVDPKTGVWRYTSARDEPRSKVFGVPHRIPITDALNRFAAWMGDNKPVWGCGSPFDNVILRNAYELAGKDVPWAFWNDRCYRTMKSRFPGVKMRRTGTHHTALSDAISQALHLQQINRNLSGE